jgi:enoyl-CoA hydratase
MAPLSYQVDDGVASITMDDGKVNVLSPEMLAELRAALDRAAGDALPVVLRGRDGIFSAGFDLKVLTGAGSAAADLLKAGFTLTERLLSFPAPTVVACTGHAIAMGLFTLLSGDYRIGVSGPYRLTANEVAIGMTLPRSATEVCRYRLAPGSFDRAVVLAEVFSPESAVTAGILDQVVAAEELDATLDAVVGRLRSLDPGAHRATKLRAREELLATLRAAIEADDADFRRAFASRI